MTTKDLISGQPYFSPSTWDILDFAVSGPAVHSFRHIPQPEQIEYALKDFFKPRGLAYHPTAEEIRTAANEIAFACANNIHNVKRIESIGFGYDFFLNDPAPVLYTGDYYEVAGMVRVDGIYQSHKGRTPMNEQFFTLDTGAGTWTPAAAIVYREGLCLISAIGFETYAAKLRTARETCPQYD